MNIKGKLLNWGKALVLPLVVWGVFSVVTGGRFATLDSIGSIIRTAVIPMLLAMTLAFGMTMGMWNFAAGAIVYACAIFGANFAQMTGLGIPGLCLFSVIIGLVLSTLMGVVYRFTRVPCLVLSLGVTMMVEALPGIFISDSTGKIKLLDGYLGNAPWCYIIVAVMFAIFVYIMSFTTLGANMRAIGSNIKIADSAGINIDKVKFLSFVLSGLFLGVAGFVQISRSVSVTAVTGFATAALIFDGIMGVFVAQVLNRYINFNVSLIIGTITIRMMGAGLVACGLSSEVRGTLTGVFLFVVLMYSANAGMLEKIRTKKRIAAAADEEYAKAGIANQA